MVEKKNIYTFYTHLHTHLLTGFQEKLGSKAFSQKNNRKKLENDSDILLGFLVVTFMAIFINIALEQNH